MINIDRLVEQFKDLTAIDSPSFGERNMADYIINVLSELNIEAVEDNAGDFYGGNAGNIYAYVKGDIKGDPILLSAHMDTVEPSRGKKAIVHSDGKITSDGSTVLGADDCAGIAEIIETLRVLKENNIRHRDIELLFPIAEEVYIKGTRFFDFDKIKSKSAYVLDLSGEIGTAAINAPTLISFEIDIIGKASHAGFQPEDGVNSVLIAAEAIANLKQGKIDYETTFNIGVISGGNATNIVPEKCSVKGEIRSLKHNKAINILQNLIDEFENKSKKYGGKCDVKYQTDLRAYQTPLTSRTVKRFEQACKKSDVETRYISTFGGSDNNSFALNNIEGIVIACGMNNCHSCEEYTTIRDLQLTTEILINLLQSEE